MQIEFTQPEKRLLLVFFALETGFQQKVKKVPCAVDGWHPIQERSYRTLWKAIDSILTKSGNYGPLSADMILAEMSADPEAIPILNSGDMVSYQEVYAILQTITSYNHALLGIHVKPVLDLLQRFLDVRLALAGANKFKGDSIGAHADYLKERLSAFSTKASKQSDFMSPVAAMPSGKLVRMKFGIDWLDRLTGGGMADGDCMLFISPSSGGKTILGTQLSWSRAQLKKHAVYLSYEQTTDEGDILIRHFAMATGLPRSEFDDKSMVEMPPDVQAKFQAAREECGEYLHIYDMSGSDQGFGGVDDYREILREETLAGRRPTIFIVDWVQTAVTRYMAAKEMSEERLTGQMDEFARKFALFCRDEKVQGVMLQQLDTANQKSRSIEPHHTLAAKCKSMAFYCRLALGIARVDTNGYGRMFMTKATTVSQDNPWCDVVMRGDLNKFEAASSDVVRNEDASYANASRTPGAPNMHSIR